jgi:hypothetical protein
MYRCPSCFLCVLLCDDSIDLALAAAAAVAVVAVVRVVDVLNVYTAVHIRHSSVS